MRKLPRKRTIAAAILLGGALILAVAAVHFIRHRLKYATTDAVFVRTDSLANLGFDGVGGRLVSMNKTEGEDVKAGEVVAVIDKSQFSLTVDKLAADLAEAQKHLDKLQLSRTRLAKQTTLDEAIASDEVSRLREEEASAEAKADSVAAEIDLLKRDSDRYGALVEAKAVAVRKVEDVNTELAARQQELTSLRKQASALKAATAGARKKVQLAVSNRLLVKESDQAIGAQKQKIAALAASLGKARDNLARCDLKSPISGRIARRFASLGDVMAPGQAVYAVVDPNDVFAVALLEENKLKGVAAGSPATLTLDAYPDLTFTGVVTEVMPASAATFALVPRDISAGEFTKVAQRIPVRIKITGGNRSLLRVGLGGEVEIKRQ